MYLKLKKTCNQNKHFMSQTVDILNPLTWVASQLLIQLLSQGARFEAFLGRFFFYESFCTHFVMMDSPKIYIMQNCDKLQLYSLLEQGRNKKL